MDATMMVVAPGPVPANSGTGTTQANGNSGSTPVFGHLLGQSLNGGETQGISGQTNQTANLLQGAGQLNQILMQLLGQGGELSPQETGKTADNTVNISLSGQAASQAAEDVIINLTGNLTAELKPDKKDDMNSQGGTLTVTGDLASAIIQLLQKAGFDVSQIPDTSGNCPNLQNLDQFTIGPGKNEGPKGQLAEALNRIIKEAGSVGDFVGKLDQLLAKVSNEAGNSPEQSAQLKPMLDFLAELKQIVNKADKQSNQLSPAIMPPEVNQTKESGEQVKVTPEVAEKQVANQALSGHSADNKENKIKDVNHNIDQDSAKYQNNYISNNDNKTSSDNQMITKAGPNTNFNRLSDNVLNQVVKKAEVALSQGQSEMKIQLQPDFLGKVNMQIKIEEGVVTAKFAAENLQVKHLIEANLHNLRQNLADQGFKVDQLSVSVGQENDFAGFQQRQGQTGAMKFKPRMEDVDLAEFNPISPTGQEVTRIYGYQESDFDYVV